MVNRKFLTLLFILTVAVAFMASCGNDGGDTIGKRSGEPIKVMAHQATLMDAPQKFEFIGSIGGDKRINLSTKIMGQITYLPYDAGTKVSAGQTLLKIKNDDLEAKKSQVLANLTQAQAALTNVEGNYNRIKTLFENKTATQKEMDDIQMAYDMSKAQVQAVKEMEREVNDYISYSDIKSPIDGYIVQKMTEVGNIAAPGMPLLVVEAMDKLEVVAKVPESQVYLFSVGDEVKIIVDALGGQEFMGAVTQVNPGGNPAARQFSVRIKMEQTDSGIKSGMYAKVILEKGARKVITVPRDWLIRRGQLTGLFTLSQNQEAMLRWVRTGKSYGDQVELLSGLSAGETVLIAQSEPIIDGRKVEVAQ